MTRALLLLALLVGEASAHGRDPYAVHIEFRPDHPQDVLAGTTIGLLTSHDGGVTWRWTCEEAVHYKDPFDPDYAYAPGGSIFVQSFKGLGVDRQTCSFLPTMLGATAISSVTTAPNGDVYVAAADTNDSSIYKSTDDGMTFTAVATPGEPGDWWRSLEIAPSDPQRIYLAGYRYTGTTKTFLLFVSRNGGTSFDTIDAASLGTTDDSLVEVVGIGNPDTVYVRVSYSTDGGDTIYRSANAGASWQKIFTNADPYGVAWLARSTGELVAATRTSGAWHSTDAGMTWQPLASPPHIASFVEAPSGEVWAATQNFLFTPPLASLPPIPADGYAIMKSTDLVTWTPVLRVQDLAGPACPTGTDVYEQCAATDLGLGTAWCCLVSTLGITSTEVDCLGPRSCGAVAGDVTEIKTPPPDGCCQGSSKPSLITVLLVLIGFGYAYRPRRAACLRARGHR